MDPEEVVKTAAEGGEIQAVAVTEKDLRKLQRLKRKAAKVVDEGEIQ